MRVETPPELHLANVLSELAVAMLTEKSLKADLERLSRVACRLIEGCSGASISMLVEGEPSTVAATDRLTLHLDMVQYDNNEGPCVQALGGEMIRIGVVSQDERFPHFAAGAADTRVQSVLSTPAIDHGTVIGSLNVYSHRQNAFDERAENTALVMASEVAHALMKSTIVDTARTTRTGCRNSMTRRCSSRGPKAC